jgi:uncharacterized protein
MSKILGLIFVALISVNVAAQDDFLRGIEVSGKASIAAVPDRFTFSVSIVERQKSAEKAKQIVDHKSDLVVNAAQKLSIAKSDIQSAQLYLRPIYRQPKHRVSELELHQMPADQPTNKLHIEPEFEQRYKSIGFEVSRSIRITLKQMRDYDKLLDELMKIAVTDVSSLQMSVSNASSIYQQALLQAMQVAKQKAMQMAGQAGVSLTNLVYVKEQSYFAHSHRMELHQQSVSGNSAHASLPGTEDITAEVLVRFAISP